MQNLIKRWLTRANLIKTVVSVLILVVVFMLGMGFGSGNFIDVFSMGNLNKQLPSQLNYSSVNMVYQALKNNYDGKLTTTQLLNGIKHGLANAVNDPYTEYFTAQQAKAFNNELNNSFSGIGAELSQNSQGDLEIIAPLNGTPAAKAGLQPKDIIAGINGKSTSNMTVEDAVTDIRGKAGTKVILTIIRGNKEFNVTIVRGNITVPSVSYKVIDSNLGYIAISSFAEDTAGLMQKAANYMVSHHVKGIILDLRNNPGGLVSAAVATVSKWLQPGQEVMQEKRGTTVLQTYDASGGDILHGIPTAILVNGGSASASEITAGALHDHNDAYIIGTKTFGKGVVQQLINFPDGSELKVTIAAWYRPDGQDINKIGITPDKVVNLNKSSTDNQLTAAETYLKSHE